jgi:hypothetical protein
MGSSAAAVAWLGGADLPRGKGPLAKKDPPLKIDETVGDLAYVRAQGTVRVEGVGLVVGLDGTGSDPEPGLYRDKILGQMRAAMVPQPERVLASKATSLVLVKATLPVGVTREDRFDADIELTPASTTTSLEGGVLLKAELTQVAYAQGRELEGKVLAWAAGPIVTGTREAPTNVKVGRVLGGTRVRADIPYALIIKDNRKSIKTAALLQTVVGRRFFRLEGVDQKGLAEAKTDQYLVLHVPKVYHQNQARYFQVLQLLPVVDTPELRAQRLEQWKAELLDPSKAGVAALKLEGLGRNAIPTLKTGLESPDPNVRFFAAEALGYLNDASGADVLAAAAVERPEFRAFALAALAASDQGGAIARLRELLSHPETEVRYGAFNALRTLDENDPFLGKVSVFEPERLAFDEDDWQGDTMALRIAAIKALRNRPAEPFHLYLVDSEGPPLVHVSNSRRSEIVVFGRRQRLLPPLVLGDPNGVLVNAGPEDDEAQLTRVAAGPDAVDRRTVSRLELGEVIRKAAQLGATYPQVVELLRSAERLKNLEGTLVVDALPAADPGYERAQLALEEPKKDESVGRASGEGPVRRPRFFERIWPKGGLNRKAK